MSLPVSFLFLQVLKKSEITPLHTVPLKQLRLKVLSESAIISLLGGIIGIIFGLAGAYGVCALMGFTAGVSIKTVLGASLFSSAVGIFFGIYPAKKAAKLSPIEALRHE